jgi:hypothetical protein
MLVRLYEMVGEDRRQRCVRDGKGCDGIEDAVWAWDTGGVKKAFA